MLIAIIFSPLIDIAIFLIRIKYHHEEQSDLPNIFRASTFVVIRHRKTSIAITITLLMLSNVGMKFFSSPFFSSSDRAGLAVHR